MTEIKVKKENVLKASEPFRKQLGIPILMGDIYKLLNDLCPEAFEEKKEPEVSELDKLILEWGFSVYPDVRDNFKQEVIALAKKKVSEVPEIHCDTCDWITKIEATLKLEGM